MIYYAGMLIKNRELPKPVRDIHDDPLQMGGDVVFESTGNPVFTHLSKTSSDRPKIDEIIKLLTAKI